MAGHLFIIDGDLTDRSYVWRPGMANWAHLDTIVEFQATLRDSQQNQSARTILMQMPDLSASGTSPSEIDDAVRAAGAADAHAEPAPESLPTPSRGSRSCRRRWPRR